MPIFLQFSNCRIIKAQTTYFEKIHYCKIYFHYGLVLTKTRYNDALSFFLNIFPLQISTFKKKTIFLKLQIANCRIIKAQNTYFANIQFLKYTFTMV